LLRRPELHPPQAGKPSSLSMTRISANRQTPRPENQGKAWKHVRASSRCWGSESPGRKLPRDSIGAEANAAVTHQGPKAVNEITGSTAWQADGKGRRFIGIWVVGQPGLEPTAGPVACRGELVRGRCGGPQFRQPPVVNRSSESSGRNELRRCEIALAVHHSRWVVTPAGTPRRASLSASRENHFSGCGVAMSRVSVF